MAGEGLTGVAISGPNCLPIAFSRPRFAGRDISICVYQSARVSTCVCINLRVSIFAQDMHGSLLGRKLLPASPGIAGHTSLQRKTMILLRILSHIPLCSGECGSYRRLARSMGECQQHMPVYWYGLNLRTSIRQMLRLAWQSHSTIRVPAESPQSVSITITSHTHSVVSIFAQDI